MSLNIDQIPVTLMPDSVTWKWRFVWWKWISHEFKGNRKM